MDTDKIANIINNGGIVIIPTDTVYGISCDATNIESVNKVYELKNRDYSKPMIVLVSSPTMLKKYCKNITELENKLIETYFPGELTIILKKNSLIPDIVTSGKEEVAIRIPNNKDLLSLIDKLNRPIISTSANISQKEVITSPSLLEDSIKNNVDYIYDDGYINNLPSTIIKVENNKINILRDGILKEDIIKKFNKYI